MLGHEDGGADIGLDGGGTNADGSEMGGLKAKPMDLLVDWIFRTRRRAVVLYQGDFALQGTFSNVWRRFCCPTGEGGATSL